MFNLNVLLPPFSIQMKQLIIFFSSSFIPFFLLFFGVPHVLPYRIEISVMTHGDMVSLTNGVSGLQSDAIDWSKKR